MVSKRMRELHNQTLKVRVCYEFKNPCSEIRTCSLMTIFLERLGCSYKLKTTVFANRKRLKHFLTKNGAQMKVKETAATQVHTIGEMTEVLYF